MHSSNRAGNHFSKGALDQIESEGIYVNDSASDSLWGRGRVGTEKPTYAFLKLPEEPQFLREEHNSITALLQT